MKSTNKGHLVACHSLHLGDMQVTLDCGPHFIINCCYRLCPFLLLTNDVVENQCSTVNMCDTPTHAAEYLEKENNLISFNFMLKKLKNAPTLNIN